MSQAVSGTPEADPLAPVRAAMIAGRVAEVLQSSEAVIVTATDPAVVVEAVMARAEALAQVGLSPDAITLLRSTREKEKAASRPDNAAKLSMAESALRMASGDMSAATTALIEAANDFGDASDTANQIRAQLQLAMTFAMTSQPDKVREILPGCVAAAQQVGDPGVLAEVRHNEGSFLAATGGDPVASFEDGLRAADRSTNPIVQVQLRVDLASATARWDPIRPAELITQAEGIATALADPLISANGLGIIAQGWWGLGRAADSFRCQEQALNRLREASAWPLFVRLAAVTADMYTVAGRPADAQRCTSEALAVGRQVGGPGGEANVMIMVGQAAMQRGDRTAGQRAFSDAVRRLQAAGLPVPPQLSAALGAPGSPT